MKIIFYKKLMAQMILNDISVDDLALLLRKSKNTICRRFKQGGFYLNEANIIRDTYFPNCSYEDIF